MSDALALYQATIVEHDRHPRNHGPLAGADRAATVDNPLCGDVVTIELRLADATIAAAGWTGRGCALARAAGSMLTVALCDISGSMGRYSEMLLRFLHAYLGEHPGHAFLFATRLSNVTRALRGRDVDRALAQCGREVADWGSGTRLGESLRRFNLAWSRRVLGQGAVVLLVTDGLERDDAGVLAVEAARLRRSCRRLIWLNPLLRYADFEARPAGIRAMLPWVDEFLPVHSLASLEALAVELKASLPD